METRITSIYERALTTTVGNVEHIESQSLNGVAVIKVFLQPQANVDGAIAEVDAEAAGDDEATSARNYAAAGHPLQRLNGADPQLGLSGKGLSEQQLNDFGTNFIRPQLATIPGAAVPLPYGGKVRQIMVDIDSSRLKSEGLSPSGRGQCDQCTKRHSAFGHGQDRQDRIQRRIERNSCHRSGVEQPPRETINGGTIFIHDVANVRDGFAVQQNIVRQDGQRGALLTIEKSGSASTLAIVSGIRSASRHRCHPAARN